MTSSSYSVSIHNQLSAIQDDAPWADQVTEQLNDFKLDLDFLHLFCSCLEKWDYSYTCHKQTKRLRSSSIINIFKVIWAKVHGRLSETWPADIQDFNSVAYELEGKIKQSKLLVEEWCTNLVRDSMEYIKSPTNDVIKHFLHTLQNIMSCFTAKIAPFQYEIDVLDGKVSFLDKFLEKLEGCKDSMKPLQFTNFAGAFANNAICLACLYWAKEADDEESVNEMSNLFFDTLLKLIPYAPDVTASYISVLNSENLLPSDSVLVAETVTTSVDFFFEHLNDFVIFRDPLILLFTSLAGENAKEKDEDLLRSQIYGLFSEHAYFLLLNQKLNDDDLSDHEMLLSDFTTKIEIANADIKQLHRHGYLDSWIKLEAENMDYLYFLPVQRELYLIKKHAPWADLLGTQVSSYIMELRLLRVFFLRFANMDDSDEEIRSKLSSMITSLQEIWRKEEESGLLSARLYETRCGDTTDWDALTPELEGKIHLSKLEIEAWWVELFQCKPSTSRRLLSFWILSSTI